MKLMFASDLHGSLSATQQLLAHFDQQGANWLILLGDFLNHGPRNPLPEGYQPADVATLLNRYASRIVAVRGNCDSEVDQMLLQFPITAPWQQVLLADSRLFLTHGHLYHPEKRPPLQAGDVLVYGHTHIPVAERRDDIYCFNPGSVSLPKGGYPASYGVLEDGVLQVLPLSGGQPLAQVAISH
ncbi:MULTISPECIES: phosphodiesterase [Dickeya]|uniref:Phosphoesterase n=1 Tax=Dickeya aquatica TaxID=1401087 RepID=A0A375A899_9GAMM|nr:MULTISPECIES: phosphodiesterase [Dickeya]SLM62332.1 FIG002292: Phosphodiesterase yfcE [Dickeya aquatica]